ncbi:hypothetical protein [Arsenophonus nasoniae]|uniref:Phage transcriptional regulator n=2 Tax=Arsenophonus nasoniae TaxID=638 RepID=A0ABY8NU08_9GAMM|nr:hypothetical protein [Arsenophonus nasoniae]WGM07860.1 hypothetical protein QE258_13920 [Arsenophonus nasoniae]
MRRETANFLFSFNFSEVIMAKKRRFINKNHEEKAHPDSPDGLLVAASKNKDFARRLVSEFRKLQGDKNGCNSHQS